MNLSQRFISNCGKVWVWRKVYGTLFKARSTEYDCGNRAGSGGVETTKVSITVWFKAGITAAGIGSNLIRNDLIAAGNYAAITDKTAEVLSWIREVQREMKQ